MFDRETRRAKILEARGRARRDNRGKSAHAEVRLCINFYLFIIFEIFKKPEKATTDAGTGEAELKEADPLEKAEKDFWKIIDDEKRKRDRKTVLVSFLIKIKNNFF
jgi:hypothetical protein